MSTLHHTPRVEILAVPDYQIAVHIVENSKGEGDLVLLHGAGVASEITWYPMLSRFSAYGRIFAVDLRGMGRSHALDLLDRPIQLDQVVSDLEAVATAFQIETVDLVGYSFGGLISLMWNAAAPQRVNRLALIEPALLEREPLDALRAVRASYAQAVDALVHHEDPKAGVTAFLDLIAPKRSTHPRVERMTVQRLAARPLGLAYALMAVNEAAWHLDRSALIEAAPATLSIIGGKSPWDAHTLHQRLADTLERWTYVVIPGVDHALPYQKPGPVADAVLAHFQR
jgi:pimeloyl-ACP methyl ester carboxylesterase